MNSERFSKNKEKLSYSSQAKTNKRGFLEIMGIVTELLPSAMFKVKIDNGHEILAHLSGKMRLNKIRLLPGDKVTLEISPYDLTKGRVIYRQ